MEEFLIIKPSPHLAPYIKNYWLLKTDVTSPAIVRTLPTGMMSLVFHRGNRILSVKERELHPLAFLSGHEKGFADLEYNGQINMISVTFKPTGVRAFFNLPINKTDALRLNLTPIDCGAEKMAFFPEENGQCPGAISFAADNKFLPSKDGVLISLTVESIEKATESISKLGGKTLIPKTKIEAEGRGYFSVFLDSEGNRVGLYSDK